MTLHLKSRGYPFRPRLLFSSFIVVGVGFPTVYYFRRGQTSESSDAWVCCSLYAPSGQLFGDVPAGVVVGSLVVRLPLRRECVADPLGCHLRSDT